MQVIIGHTDDQTASSMRSFLITMCMGVPMADGTIDVDQDLLYDEMFKGVITIPTNRQRDPIPPVYFKHKESAQ